MTTLYKQNPIIKFMCALLCAAVLAAAMPSVTSDASKAGNGRETAAEVLAEGAVLLKNNGSVLPVSPGERIAVFGNAQIDFLVGGGGSSVMFTDYTVSPLEGLKNAEAEGKISLCGELADAYTKYVGKTQEMKAVWGTDAFYEKYVKESIEMDVSDELWQTAADFADTAVFFISRYATEGTDMSAEEGSYYLSAQEEEILSEMTSRFENTIVILNIPSAIDLSLIAGDSAKYDVDAILSVWYPGEEAGNVIADILTGDVNPSGKLSQTFAKSWDSYYSSANWDNKNTVLYEEDIFVGYRQFQTFDPEDVVFGFGYGLSYTDFGIKSYDITENNGTITINIDVVNIGSRAGKEVMQVYYSAPKGILGNPAAELACFVKTPLLEPGESANVTCSFSVNDMASYDDTGKIQKSAYILEQGDYGIYVGNSLSDAMSRSPLYTYTVSENTVTEQLTECCASTKLEKRLTADGTYETLEKHKAERDTEEIAGFDNPDEGYTGDTITLYDVYKDESNMGKFLAQLDTKTLAELAGGQGGSAIVYAAGSFIGNLLDDYGGTDIYVTDGGQGLRVYTLATYFPSGTCLACTFNTELAQKYGEVIGSECISSGIDVWLGPGMNIIRNPLCGRNFEYYSEDPYLTGKIAAAVTIGVQSYNVAVCAKHYVANNKEENRGPQNSVVSERALREIYLKGFEILVKDANPWMMMTSCGTVNSTGVAGNYDLMTEIPRNEWGWDGVFMSDWANMDGEVAELKAGHNISMPSSTYTNLVKAESKGKITRAQLEENARLIVKLLLKLHSVRRAIDPDYEGYVYDLSENASSKIYVSSYANASGGKTALNMDGSTLSYSSDETYKFYVTALSGNYSASVFYKLSNPNNEITVTVDGGNVLTLTESEGTYDSDSDYYGSSSFEIPLTEGEHCIEVKCSSSGSMLGWVDITDLSYDEQHRAEEKADTTEEKSGAQYIWIIAGGCVLAAVAAAVVIILVLKKKTHKKEGN